MIVPDDVEVFAYSRNDGVREHRFGALEDVLDLAAIAEAITITEIYVGISQSLQLRLPLLPDNGHALQIRTHQ